MDTFEHLAVNASDLIEALETRLDEGFWVVDLESGEIHMAGNDAWEVEGEEDPDFEDPDRFIGIQPLPSHEAFQIMESFVESLPGNEGSRSLARALGHSRPFRSFKDTLIDFPKLREAWFKYHHDQMLIAAQEWLEENLPGAKLNLDPPNL